MSRDASNKIEGIIMGIKIVVDSSGLYQVPTSGTSTEFEMPGAVENLGPMSPPQVGLTGSAVTAGSKSYVLVQPTSAAVTASLPAISSGMLGRQFVFMNTHATQDMVLSGTDNIGGTTWERAFPNAYSSATVMAVSGAGGFYWHVISSV